MARRFDHHIFREALNHWIVLGSFNEGQIRCAPAALAVQGGRIQERPN